MQVTVVGEDNAEAYAGSIIEDLLDRIVVNYRVNKDFKLLEDDLLGNDRGVKTPEYVEEDDEKTSKDEKMDLVTSTKALCLDAPVDEICLEIPDEGIDLECPENLDLLSPVKEEDVSPVKKEDVSPVKRFYHPRGIMSDYWAVDSPRKPKVFTLSGFVARGKYYTPEVVEQEKKRTIESIKFLGGTIIETDKWHDDITHVVAFSLADMERMTEKIMSALAAGRWVVTTRYVKKSLQEGEWLSPLK